MARWFYNVPKYAITNYQAIRAAAVAAGVTIVESRYRLDGETEAPGKPAATIDPNYVPNPRQGFSNTATYGALDQIRKSIHSKLVAENQARVEAGQPEVPMPSTEALERLAQIEYDRITNPEPPSIVVTGVTVSPATASVKVGATVPLSATVAPANASNKNVTWSSSDQSKATVNASGVVTGVAVGSATITATTADGNKTATSAVTVTAA